MEFLIRYFIDFPSEVNFTRVITQFQTNDVRILWSKLEISQKFDELIEINYPKHQFR